MSTRICETFEESLNILKLYKKKYPNFNGHITITFDDFKFDKSYNEGLEAFLKNPLSEFINSHNYLAEKDFKPSLSQLSELSQAVHIYKDLLDTYLYKNTVDTSLYIQSLYGNPESPCYLNIFDNKSHDTFSIVNKNKALAHIYKNRLLCIEVSSNCFYFKGDKDFFSVSKVLDAEQVILKILTRIYDIDFTRNMYGY